MFKKYLLSAISIIIILSSFILLSLEQRNTKSFDSERKGDIRMLMMAQELWHKENGRFYTCGSSAIVPGDCGGQLNNYPVSIGSFMTPRDPSAGEPYNALDNTADSQKFCYYAILDDGTFYTASHLGIFHKTAEPASLDDCAQD